MKTLHEKLVEGMLDRAGRSVPQTMKALREKYPEATDADFETAIDEAVETLREQAEQDQAEADALDSLAPLFEGMPPDMPLGECARIKAEQGDPLAIAFLQWERDQAGGLQ